MANQKLKSRRGYMLVYALVITIIGASLALGIFSLARLTHTTDIISRAEIQEEIDVSGIIEETKGIIVRENYKRSDDLTGTSDWPAGYALHCDAGEDAHATTYNFDITGIDGLEISRLRHDKDLSGTVKTPSGTGYVARCRVYDVNYQPVQVAAGLRGALPSGWPPPLSTLNRGNSNAATNAIIYKRLGAYLVRVDVFLKTDTARTRPMSRTEELFYMFMPE